MVFEVPRIQNVTIDGKKDDWKDAGLALDVLAALPSESRDPDTFDARAQIGWDDRGLLVACDVTDTAPFEGDPIWSGDSVEIFVGDAVGGKNFVQLMVAPGTARPELRQDFGDHRSDTSLKSTAKATFARTRNEKGYLLEGLVPWELLGVKPASGRELAVQIYVNDYKKGHDLRRLTWFPAAETYQNSHQMQPIRLSDHASPSINTTAGATLQGWRVQMSLATSGSPEDLHILSGTQEIARPSFEKRGRVSFAELDVPVDGDHFGPVDVVSNGAQMARLKIDDLAYRRKQAFQSIGVVAKPAVFSSNNFPSIEFEQPAVAKELLGRTTFMTSFYDADHNLVTSADKPGRYGAEVEVFSAPGKSFKKRLTLFRLPKDVRMRDLRVDAQVTVSRDIGISPEVLKNERRTLGEWFKSSLQSSSNRGDDAAKVLARLYEKSTAKTQKPADKQPDVGHNGPWAADERWWHEQRKRNGDLEPYQYVTILPEGAESPGGDKHFPTILFLHGSGERGHDLSVLSTWGPVAAAKRKGTSFPFIVIAPQCPEGIGWSTTLLEDLIADIESKYPVDKDRLYLTGLSMGGFGSWALAGEHPDWFAAIAPVCGGGDIADAASLADVPIWDFHGAKDEAVAPERSIEMVSALRQHHGRVLFTLYPNEGHSSWTPTYLNDRLYSWFLEQKRAQPKQARATKQGPKADFDGSEAVAANQTTK
jgi:predicted esterase